MVNGCTIHQAEIGTKKEEFKVKKNANGKYAITTIFYDSGAVEARETKPEDKPGEHEKYDLYIDEFDKKQEALDFIKEAKEA